jgi:hypothetical protein
MLLKLKWFLIINSRERCQRKPFRLKHFNFVNFKKSIYEVDAAALQQNFDITLCIRQNLNFAFFAKNLKRCWQDMNV